MMAEREPLRYRFHVGEKVRWDKHPSYPYVVAARAWSLLPEPGTMLYIFAHRRLRYVLRYDSPGGGHTPWVAEEELRLFEE
jgi:hypothetical protein